MPDFKSLVSDKQSANNTGIVKKLASGSAYVVDYQGRTITVKSAVRQTLPVGCRVLIGRADDGRLYITSAEQVRSKTIIKEVRFNA